MVLPIPLMIVLLVLAARPCADEAGTGAAAAAALPAEAAAAGTGRATMLLRACRLLKIRLTALSTATGAVTAATLVDGSPTTLLLLLPLATPLKPL